MGALGLESVLVGDVGDRVDDAVGARVGVGAADDERLVFGAGVDQLALLLLALAVAGLHAGREMVVVERLIDKGANGSLWIERENNDFTIGEHYSFGRKVPVYRRFCM